MAKFWERRNAVQHYTGAHNVVGLLIEGESAGALQHVRLVTSGNFCADFVNDFLESSELVASVFGVFVGYRQVRRDAVDLDIRHSRHALEHFVRDILHNTHSSHAGVDLEIDGRWLQTIERLSFLQTGDGGDKTVLGNNRAFLGSGGGADEHWMFPPVAAPRSLSQVGHATKI